LKRRLKSAKGDLLNILQVVPYFYPAYAFGGPVKVAYSISKELVKRGHRVTVYTTDIKSQTERLIVPRIVDVDGIEVHYMRNLCMAPVKMSNLFLSPELISTCKSELRKFDIIHLHEFTTFQNVVVSHYARKYGVPYVLHAHGSVLINGRKARKLLFNALFSHEILGNASRVIAISRAEAQQYMFMGVPKEKVSLIPNGIELSEYVKLPPKEFFKRKYDIQGNKQIILYLGRINKTKGLDFLVKAYAYMIKTMKCDNTMLVIAGSDDGYLVNVKQLVAALKISHKVAFIGMLSEEDKKCAFAGSNIVVNVEPKNVFGLVPLEAAACAIPVIVSKGNAICKIVSDGKFGYSVDYADVASLASSLRELLTDEELAENIGKNGRKYVFKNFSWSERVKECEQIYKEIVG
jgi:glycosyltransferase involved in cell wall biosynthesis